MKKILRLTEGDLRTLVSNSVMKILKEASGYVPNDGNGMVGGRWESWDESGECNVLSWLENNIDKMAPRDMGEDEYNRMIDYLYANEDVFTLVGHFSVSYDESTGYGSSSSPVYEFKNIEGEDAAIAYIKKYPGSPEIVNMMLSAFKKTVNSLDEGDFDL